MVHRHPHRIAGQPSSNRLSSYTSVASTDLDESTLQYLSGPTIAHDIEVTHADRGRPPLSLDPPSILVVPVGE
jgi:hypothetical protein